MVNICRNNCAGKGGKLEAVDVLGIVAFYVLVLYPDHAEESLRFLDCEVVISAKLVHPSHEQNQFRIKHISSGWLGDHVH
jgi:hypothetical protein